MKPKIQIKRVATYCPKIPEYATPGSAGLDIRSPLNFQHQIAPGETFLLPTGFAININCPSVAAVLIPRSGLGHRNGIVLGNLVGLIDSDYQQEVFISLWNRSDKCFTINPGDRIAQLVFVPVIQVEFDVVDEFTNTTDRTGGLGSTGVK